MTVSLWRTDEAPPPAFEARWNARLARSPRAGFALDPAFLAWSARHGEPGVAALVDEHGRRGALALRATPDGFTCGWPWRWQAMVETEDTRDPLGMSVADAAWLHEKAIEIAGGRRLTCFLPAAPRGVVAGYPVGATCVRSLEATEPELLKSFVSGKRRFVQRAAKRYQVIEASTIEHFRAFADLQDVHARIHSRVRPATREASPAPGEGHREWELPWMWLLLALEGDTVVAGSGFGIYPGGSVDYRTNASTEEARREGANTLLAWEAMRRARAGGHRWINWCGATKFKRDLGTTAVPVWAMLSGGAAWGLSDHLAASLRRARPHIAGWWRSLKPQPEGRPA